MSIHAISGKPGGGKSMFAVKALLNEIRQTDRFVVTNLAVKPEPMAEYLHKTYGQTFNLLQRLTVLDEDQTAKFWLYRGNGLVLPDREQNDYATADAGNFFYAPKKGAVCRSPVNELLEDFERRGGQGVAYYIDEIHLFFNAREWQKTGKAAIYYLSQHRKANNDVIWITQSIQNVEKQFRSLTQDFTYLRNHRNEKLLSVFRSFPWFSFKTYQEPFSGGQQPTEQGRFLLDAAGLASCYDTAKGVGFAGGVAADTKKSRRGLPLSVLVVALILFCVSLPFLFVGLSNLLARAATSPLNRLKVPMATPAPNRGVSGSPDGSPATGPETPTKAKEKKDDESEVTMDGICTDMDGGWIIALSDGRLLHTKYHEVEQWNYRHCVVDGKEYKMTTARPHSDRTAFAGRSGPDEAVHHVELKPAQGGVSTFNAAPQGDSSGWNSRQELRIHYADGSVIVKPMPKPSPFVWQNDAPEPEAPPQQSAASPAPASGNSHH